MDYRRLTQPPQPAAPMVTAIASGLLLSATIFGFAAWQAVKRHPVHHESPAPTPSAALPASAAPSTPTDANAEKRAADIDKLLQRQWSHGLLAVEKASGKGVTILELHPNFDAGTFILKGEALTFDELSAYIGRLNETKLVRQVRLAHEQAISRDNVETVEFEIQGDL
jgi:hypothetical protein